MGLKAIAGGGVNKLTSNDASVTLTPSGGTGTVDLSVVTSGSGTPGGTTGQVQYKVNSTTFGGFTASGDATINTTTGAVTVTKTGGSAFAASATTDTTTTANITDSTDKRFVTDAEEAVIDNTSGTNTGDQTADGTTLTLTGTTFSLKTPIATSSLPSNQTLRKISVGFDGGGSALTAGKIVYLAGQECAGTITSWSLVADVSGSIVIDVWKANAAVPTVANTIDASALPTLSAAQSAFAGAITGWTTSIAVNDVWAFKINSATTVTEASLVIYYTAS